MFATKNGMRAALLRALESVGAKRRLGILMKQGVRTGRGVRNYHTPGGKIYANKGKRERARRVVQIQIGELKQENGYALNTVPLLQSPAADAG